MYALTMYIVKTLRRKCPPICGCVCIISWMKVAISSVGSREFSSVREENLQCEAGGGGGGGWTQGSRREDNWAQMES